NVQLPSRFLPGAFPLDLVPTEMQLIAEFFRNWRNGSNLEEGDSRKLVSRYPLARHFLYVRLLFAVLDKWSFCNAWCGSNGNKSSIESPPPWISSYSVASSLNRIRNTSKVLLIRMAVSSGSKREFPCDVRIALWQTWIH